MVKYRALLLTKEEVFEPCDLAIDIPSTGSLGGLKYFSAIEMLLFLFAFLHL